MSSAWREDSIPRCYARSNHALKDYYDIWVLSRTYAFADDRLARAIAATFARRQTETLAEPPDALSQDFAEDPMKLRQWAAFASDIVVDRPFLGDVVGDLAAFVMSKASEARKIAPNG